jgi:hypothetical protein
LKDDEKVFLIDQSMRFFCKLHEKSVLFQWSDPVRAFSCNGNNERRQIDGLEYQFSVDSKTINKHMFDALKFDIDSRIDLFETTMLECMFERHFKKSHELATVDDLEAMKYHHDGYILVVESCLFYHRKIVASKPAEKTPARKQEPAKTISPPPASNVPQGESLIQVTANLYLYQPASCQFVLQANTVRAEIKQTAPYAFWLVIFGQDGDRPVICQPLDTSMNPVFSSEFNSFIWVYHDGTIVAAFAEPAQTKAIRPIRGRCASTTRRPKMNSATSLVSPCTNC